MDRRAVWVSGGMMAALGALLGLQEARTRLTELAAHAASFAGGPAPRALDWIDTTARAQRTLALLQGWLAAAAALLLLALAWRLLRLLNPSGSLLASGAPVAESALARLQAPLERPLVRRSMAAAFGTFFLLGGLQISGAEDLPVTPPYLWGLPGLVWLWPARPWVGMGIAFLLCGAALWLLWGEWGAVPPRQSRTAGWPSVLARGLLAGAAALPVLLPLTTWGRGVLDAVLTAVGLTDPVPWRIALWGLIFGLPLAFFALGVLGHALARPRSIPAGATAVAACFLLVLGAGEVFFFNAVVRGRYDFGRDLAALVGAGHRPSSARTFLIFPPPPVPGPLAGAVPYLSIQEIDAGGDSPARTWQYLRRRNYECAGAGDAFVHLHDCASLRWDSAESLRVDLANLQHNPQPIFAELLLEKLFTCATTPENRALLRQAADPARFRADPQWLRTLGALQDRFGDRAAAAALLRRAGLTPAETRQAMGAEAPLTSGTVTGQIMVNGRLGVGLTAGLLPARRWQSLVGAPHPFELRWVAAAAPTDADGRFRLRDLAQGDTVLIVMGDPQHLPLRGPGARSDRSPGLLRLDTTHPARDLGTIRIDTSGSPSPEGLPRMDPS